MERRLFYAMVGILLFFILGTVLAVIEQYSFFIKMHSAGIVITLFSSWIHYKRMKKAEVARSSST
ncbi:hypothetical protein [Sporosarcina cyprini]|uniref:hypothetical protein n=1 Tax=Sporosarcina cyprini TaxID=2910523 RepID=UPI001EDFE6B0|nr:hypothetical protein [Sporosarcina cyprini]MCG3086813.1 hypothetical protein [Sporosarcina cyprini]